MSIKFKAVDPGYEEVTLPGVPHEKMVKLLALGKAQAAAKKYPNAIIVAAGFISQPVYILFFAE